MIESSAVVRRVEWGELFPWLILLRTFRIAISPAALTLATAAVLLSPLGWWAAGQLLLTPSEWQSLAAVGQLVPQAENSQLAGELPAAARAFLLPLPNAVLEAYFDLAEPLARLFRLDLSLRTAAYCAGGFLWTLALWALPGGFITRRSVVQLATGAAPGAWPTLTFALRRYVWYFLAPLYPLLGVVLLGLPIAVLGLVVRASASLGALVAGALWLVVVLISVAAMWLLGGLVFGWPLMWPAISAEREGDAFEAFSRSYSYVYGKPLRYFFYVVVAALFGALCVAVVDVAAGLVREFGFWSLAWGGGGERVADIREQALHVASGEDLWLREDRAWTMGTTLIGLFVWLIQTVATAFRFSFFFAVASAMYLLLRQDVDEKELDEVYGGTEPTGGADAGQ